MLLVWYLVTLRSTIVHSALRALVLVTLCSTIVNSALRALGLGHSLQHDHCVRWSLFAARSLCSHWFNRCVQRQVCSISSLRRVIFQSWAGAKVARRLNRLRQQNAQRSRPSRRKKYQGVWRRKLLTLTHHKRRARCQITSNQRLRVVYMER